MGTDLIKKPQEDTNYAHAAAIVLKEIVRKNGWAIKLGTTEHLKYEAWQTIGKYYGLSVKTGEAVFVKYGEIEGFEAKAWVIDRHGVEVGGAEAACMRDEPNWKIKPLFQLKSMAQTRAGSKALRQVLGFVVAMAGYNPTPAEEMTDTKPVNRQFEGDPSKPTEDEVQEGQIQNECTCGSKGRFHKRDCPMHIPA